MTLTFFHAPQTRSTGVAILLEELGAPHDVHLLDIKAGEQRQPAFLAINPMGKVPAVRDGDALITEQVALFIYLPDRFPAAGLAPALDDPQRGPYLRWIAFYGSCFEPAIVDRAMKREPASLAMSPYGDFTTVQTTLLTQLAAGPYLLGDRFSAADLLWGVALNWIVSFGLMPPDPLITAYIEHITTRPAVVTATTRDAKWAEEQAAKPT